MEVKLTVVNNGTAVGTVGWLAANAHHINIGDIKGRKGRGAWLMDEQGKAITVLATAEPNLGVLTVERNDRLGLGPVSDDIPWTDAAWKVLQTIARQAAKLLEEPEEMAEAYVVSIGHKNPQVRALTEAAQTDLAARAALIDHIQGQGD